MKYNLLLNFTRRILTKMNKPVISILSAFMGAMAGAGTVGKMSADRTQRIQSMSDKHLALFLMMNQWVKVKQDGKTFLPILKRTGIRRLRSTA